MRAYGIISTFVVIVLLAAVTVQCLEIHERMTDDEIDNFFHTTRDAIPEYFVVPVRHKRSNQNLRLQFTAFGEEIDAYLHQSNGQLMGANTPVWLAFTKPDGTVEYKKMREGIVGIVLSSFFTSPTDSSTVVVTQTKGKNAFSFNGIVDGMIIRPLPKNFQEEVRSRRNSEVPNANRTMLDIHYHVIIKLTSVIQEEKIRHLERQIREASPSGNNTDGFRYKRSDAETIYPSVLVQTDYKVSKTTAVIETSLDGIEKKFDNLFHRQNDLDYYEEILYQIAYWNAVDLRFRHANNPKIRLRIVGIIIGQDRTATPYLENYRTGNVIDLGRAFDALRKYWYYMTLRDDFPKDAYDIVVTLTDTAMTYNRKRITGLATASFCLKSWRSQKLSGAAIALDNGGFDGILTTAHELGHVFGLDHDPNYDHECDDSNGFIMAAKRGPSPKNLEWSPCSLKHLSNFLRLRFIDCYDQPADFYPPGNPVQILLPGDVWGPHKQCQARGYDEACDPNPDMCKLLQCYHTHWLKLLLVGRRCENTGPAAEGTLCAPGRKCVDGVCQCMTTDCIYKN